MKKFSNLLLAAILALPLSPCIASTSSCDHWTVTKTMVIDAPVDQVWQASKSLRLANTNGHHVISHNGTTTQVRENFEVPVLGPVSCIYAEQENEPKNVQYHLVSSPNFIAFEGSWQFTPVGNKQTSVTLTSFADTGSQIMFASRITKKQVTQTVDQRMSDLQNLAMQRSIAALPH